MQLHHVAVGQGEPGRLEHAGDGVGGAEQQLLLRVLGGVTVLPAPPSPAAKPNRTPTILILAAGDDWPEEGLGFEAELLGFRLGGDQAGRGPVRQETVTKLLKLVFRNIKNI